MILIVIDDPHLGEVNHANSVVIPCYNCAKLRTFCICQKYSTQPYFATKSHAVMVDHWSTSNNYS
jgi:hypothetical protein